MTYRFHWIVPRVLAGVARPGASGSLRADLEFLEREGIRAIVSLTERPLPETPGSPVFRLLHVPVADFDTPQFDDADRVCSFIDEVARGGASTVLHCLAGLGRTGTLAACYLTHMYGMSGDEAITRVREIDAGYIQTLAQEEFVRNWAAGKPPRRT